VDDNLAIKIIDTGIGIPEEVKKKVFKSMVTTKGLSGSGIGLYISKLILEARFNASIEYEDNPGGGTIFTVTIPSEHFKIN
jgi:signal transduction histidine kinase